MATDRGRAVARHHADNQRADYWDDQHPQSDMCVGGRREFEAESLKEREVGDQPDERDKDPRDQPCGCGDHHGQPADEHGSPVDREVLVGGAMLRRGERVALVLETRRDGQGVVSRHADAENQVALTCGRMVTHRRLPEARGVQPS